MFCDESSVSRRDADVRSAANGWWVRYLGRSNGTFLNGNRLGAGEWPLRPHDILRFGNVTVVVDVLKDGADSETNNPRDPDNLLAAATASSTWEDALSGLIFDRNRSPPPGEHLLALLRAGHH